MRRGARRTAVTVVTAACLIAGISACSGPGDESDSGTIEPAPSASDPACAGLTGRVPATVLGRQAVSTDVAGAATWGDPAIVLRCGVPPPGPTTDACIAISGVDWVFSETDAAYRFVTYGRTPAVEVTVPLDVERSSASGAAAALSPAVEPIPQQNQCIGLDDT